MVHVNMMDPDSDEMDMDERAPSNRSASPANGPSSSSKAATLKRGDACLACRRRRIRCSAEKPACATCVRLKKQCVYETGKSTSRIAVLKARIADLESQLKERTPAPGPSITVESASSSGPSGVGSSSSPAAPPAPTPVSPGRGHTINPSALAFSIPTVQGAILPVGPNELDGLPTPSNSNNSQSGPSSASNPTPAPSTAAFTPAPHSQGHGHGHSHHHTHAHSHGHQPTSTVRNAHYAQSTNPRPFGEPDPAFDMDLSFLDQPVSDLSASMFVATVTSQVDSSHVDMGFATSHTEEKTSHKSLRHLHSTAKVGHDFSRLVGMRLEGLPYDSDTGDEAMDALASGEILPSVPLGRELVGGWFDPTDVPPGVRDHLLDLFFSRTNSKSPFVINFHLPRFYTRLTLPASKRPHPALLYSMYATAARVSTQPAIKQLENQFFEIADRQIRQAVAQHDRLLDALRGMALLTNYLFAKEKYSLGYHMTGAAVRLAISCGLDRIPSSVWTPPPPFNAAIHCTLRTGGYSIPPPEDPIDLAERIYAFWAVYEIDLCTAVAYLWHTGLPIEDIRTPFPRPMIDYELGLVSHKDDVSINSILNPTLAAGQHIDNSFFVLRMKAITLLARVLKLRQERPEVDLGAEGPTTPLAGPHVCSYPGSSQPAFVTHPTGFAKIKQALDHLVDQLPEEHRPPWRWDEGETVTLPRRALSRDTSVLHFLIGNAYMQLWNVRALDADNAVALLVARRLVNVMYLFQTEPMSTGYDIFMITIWNEVAMVLVRETKRLAHHGEAQRAADIDADLGVAIASMKKWGDVDISNEHDGADIAAINGKMLDQLRAMSKDDWAEAMAESQRRFGAGELGVLPCNVPPGGGGAGHI